MFTHFLNPFNALLAAAIACPVLLLLYFLKLRRRPEPVSSTLLWQKAIHDLQVNSPFQRLRKNLLLLLQMLLLLLLCLALAEPVIRHAGGPGNAVVILLDRSASMGATDGDDGGSTRLAQAKRQAGALVDSLGRHAQAMVIAFDDSAQTMQSFTSDKRGLKSAIDAITQTDRKSALSLAFATVEAQHVSAGGDGPGQPVAPEVWLYSDGRVADADRLQLHAPLRYCPIGSPDSKNIAIVALSARRSFDQPTQVLVFARLANFGPDPVTSAQATLLVDGHVQAASADLTLLPQRWTDAQRQEAAKHGLIEHDGVAFPPLELTRAARLTVEQTNKNGDVLAADDSASLIVPPPKTLSVLLVTEGNFALRLAFKQADTITPEIYAQHITHDGGGAMARFDKPYDVVVFDKYSPPALPSEGNFIYFAAIPPGTSLHRALDAQGQPIVIPENQVLDWKRDHPLLRYLSLSKLAAAMCDQLLPTLDSVVLAEGTHGPMMVLHTEAGRRHLVMPFSLLQSTWRTNANWPLFAYNARAFLSLGTDADVRQSYAPGATLRVPRFNLQAMSPITSQITLDGPGGSRSVAVPSTGDLPLPSLDRVGIYRTTPAIPGYEEIAVNLLDANESDTLPVAQPPISGADAQVVSQTQTRVDLWWWICAAGILPMVLIEWWVYTRRVHG